jgi:hypothetical protein
MSLTFRALLLTICVSLSANAQTHRLALYADPVPGLDVEATAIMRAELQRLMAPAGIDVLWRSLVFRKAGENFDLVVVSSFEGSCTSGDGTTDDGAASLADTSIADGHILPFFRVDCNRLIRLLGSRSESAVVGRALARVVGHEIYHIVAQTTEHHAKGLAKASFSVRDLTANPFDLDALSVQRMRASLIPIQTSSYHSPLR